MDNSLAPAGSRIALSGYYGTVRYTGPVDGTSGLWLGIEWDDPKRGKHPGTKDGKQYFLCRHPTSGSFVRPSANISYGTSFLDALHAKYVESLHGSGSQETVILGSSRGTIEVEAVRLDKIRGKFADLRALREVSLDNELVARGNELGSIRQTCPNIRGLDLSLSLLPSWDVVALIAAELPVLERLSLNRNRLCLGNFSATAFGMLTELHLNETLTTWSDVQQIISVLPRLRILEMGYNELSRLTESPATGSSGSDLHTINLDSNLLGDWVHICQSLIPFKLLDRVILTSNRIRSIPLPSHDVALPSVKHITLTSNLVADWCDIDALGCWFPRLETLAIGENPLVKVNELSRHARPFIIARISSLVTLNGSSISTKERTDSELFYLSYFAQHRPQTYQEHPRWAQLCKKHGNPESSSSSSTNDKLSNRLMEVNLFRCFEPSPMSEGIEPAHITVLPAMTLRTLRLKICKIIKCSINKVNIHMWLRMADDLFSELSSDKDQQQLDWLGIEEGSNIVFYMESK